jgi:hypothetical protein
MQILQFDALHIQDSPFAHALLGALLQGLLLVCRMTPLGEVWNRS